MPYSVLELSTPAISTGLFFKPGIFFVTTKQAAIHHVLTSNSPRCHHPKTIENRPFS